MQYHWTTLVELLRQAWISIYDIPLAWVCALLMIMPGYILECVFPPSTLSLFVLVCGIGLLWMYSPIVASIGLIVIASQPPPDQQLTLRRLLMPDLRTGLRFIALLVLSFLVFMPVLLPVTTTNVSKQLAELGSEISIPQIPLIWTIPLLVIFGPMVATLELAQREVVLVRSGVIRAIRLVWPLTIHNIPLLILVFGLIYAARYAVSSLPPVPNLLLSIVLTPFFSALGTRVYIMLANQPDGGGSQAPS